MYNTDVIINHDKPMSFEEFNTFIDNQNFSIKNSSKPQNNCCNQSHCVDNAPHQRRVTLINPVSHIQLAE